jgi:PAS domain S-box-containing protein
LKNHFKRSLKTRVTVFSLAIFLFVIWSLAFYASQMLRQDMQRVFGAQQFSTADVLAADINANLEARFADLNLAGKTITPAMLAQPESVRAHLQKFLLLQDQFSGGTFAIGTNGNLDRALALVSERLGARDMDSDFLKIALQKGQSTVGRPILGEKLDAPVFAMAVPIRDQANQVVGALVGMVDLGKPNFLTRITSHTYGKTGGFSVVAPQYRMIIVSTDKRRNLEILPPQGSNPTIDRAMRGEDLTEIYTSTPGVERLTSVKRIPATGWFLVASVRTDEAFAPIHQMQQRLALATLVATVLVAALMWWMLRRQLSPLQQAARALVVRGDEDRPVQALPVVEPDEIGELIGGFNHLLSILGQREEALKESRFLWKFAIEGSGDGVWDWNIQTGETDYDTRCREILAYALDDEMPIGQAWRSHIHPDDRSLVAAAMQACLEGKTDRFESEYRMQCKNGRYKWLLSRGAVVSRSEDGRPKRMIGTNSDVTRRQQLQAQLLRSMHKLEEKEKSRTRFLAAAGHDLRQPIAATSLFVEALKSTAPSPRQLELIGLLGQSVAVFSSQLDRLLDISKFDAGLIQAEPTDVDVAGVFDWLYKHLAANAWDKGLRFSTYMSKNLPVSLQTDHHLLQSVLMNLVSNAIKYTNTGGVLVSARARGGRVLFQVWDTGIGIEQSDLRAIFDEFYQVGNRQRNREAGLGLGLSICTRALEVLGSEVRCRSQFGRGSVFSFSLPLVSDSPLNPSKQTDLLRPDSNDDWIWLGKRIMVLEDDPLVSSGLLNLLREVGADASHFETAEAALSSAGIGAVDYFIVDYSLGGELTGLDFLHAVQVQQEHPVRAVVITGETSSDFMRRMASSPWPVLHKPVTFAKLVSALNGSVP